MAQLAKIRPIWSPGLKPKFSFVLVQSQIVCTPTVGGKKLKKNISYINTSFSDL
jgi:hypothetical protein